MSDCPYFDTSHSMAVLHYVCKAGKSPQKISPEDADVLYPCFTDKYVRCQRYPDRKGTEKKKG